MAAPEWLEDLHEVGCLSFRAWSCLMRAIDNNWAADWHGKYYERPRDPLNLEMFLHFSEKDFYQTIQNCGKKTAKEIVECRRKYLAKLAPTNKEAFAVDLWI